jgi:hypothetical protein
VPFALLSPFIPGIGESLRSARTAKAWQPAKYLREVFAALFMWDFQGRKARHFFSRTKGLLDSLGQMGTNDHLCIISFDGKKFLSETLRNFIESF